ncbi:MAG: hypothetical protein AB7O43_03840 [Hyphomicrobiaceae bacterium]
MRRFLLGLLPVLAMTAVFAVAEPQRAEARGGRVAAGIAAAVIGGVILHHTLRRHNRRYYHRRHRYYPAYGGYYYRPYRYHRPRCIWRHGSRYCRY